MYRRIELISHLPIDVEGIDQSMFDTKGVDEIQVVVRPLRKRP
jgi:hypothetical protein